MDELIRHYFSDPERQIDLAANQVILQQNGSNDRLYYVREGELEGFVESESKGKRIKVFTAGPSAFIGVHSFFSGTWIASSTVISKRTSNWLGLIAPRPRWSLNGWGRSMRSLCR